MAGRRSEQMFLIRAVDINIALVGVGVSFLSAIKPQDARGDEIAVRFECRAPQAYRLAGTEDGAPERPGSNLVRDHELP